MSEFKNRTYKIGLEMLDNTIDFEKLTYFLSQEINQDVVYFPETNIKEGNMVQFEIMVPYEFEDSKKLFDLIHKYQSTVISKKQYKVESVGNISSK